MPSYRAKDIVYESGRYWALKVSGGFEIYKTGVTHSTRCAQIGFTGELGLAKVKAEIQRRTLEDAK